MTRTISAEELQVGCLPESNHRNSSSENSGTCRVIYQKKASVSNCTNVNGCTRTLFFPLQYYCGEVTGWHLEWKNLKQRRKSERNCSSLFWKSGKRKVKRLRNWLRFWKSWRRKENSLKSRSARSVRARKFAE